MNNYLHDENHSAITTNEKVIFFNSNQDCVIQL